MHKLVKCMLSFFFFIVPIVAKEMTFFEMFKIRHNKSLFLSYIWKGWKNNELIIDSKHEQSSPKWDFTKDIIFWNKVMNSDLFLRVTRGFFALTDSFFWNLALCCQLCFILRKHLHHVYHCKSSNIFVDFYFKMHVSKYF